MSEYQAGDGWRPGRKDTRATAWRLASGEDIERTLTAAERLLQASAERRRHQQNRAYALASVLVTLGIAMFASLATVARYGPLGQSALAMGALLASTALAVAGAACIVLLRRNAFDARRNLHSRLASELAALVRESYLEVAERESWSYLHTHAVKLRLAAFPLLPDDDIRVSHRRKSEK